MNPLGYLGANPLDIALADRFAQVVFMDDEFSSADLKKIISTEHESDAPGLNIDGAQNQDLSVLKSDLNSMIQSIRHIYRNELSTLEPVMDTFIVAFYHQVRKNKLSISPRRAAMMKRNLKTYIAIDIYSTQKKSIDPQNFITASESSWLYPVVEDENHLDILKECIFEALHAINVQEIDQQSVAQTESILNTYRQHGSTKNGN